MKQQGYTACWYRYPHGIAGEAMECHSKDFDSLEKAVEFLRKKLLRIKSVNWAGAHVEDENCKWLFDITDGGECEYCNY